MRRLAALVVLVLAAIARTGCGPISVPPRSPHWELVFVNQTHVAQVVTVTIGTAGPPLSKILGAECAVVDSHSEARFAFGDTPPSFAYVDCGLGRVTVNWPGSAPPYACGFWMWRFIYDPPGVIQKGEDPIR